MKKLLRTNIGRELNEKWEVHAQHALYRANGTWYHILSKFPGALFDENGYVLFETQADYLKCSQLHHGKQTSCPKGISSIANYVLVNKSVEQASDLAEPKKTERILCVTKRIVRDTPLARRVKKLHGNRCQLCGLTLLLFGGENYAEAHHIKPLGSVHQGPDVFENIICVCPNCHAQLDYGAIELNTATLHFIPEHSIGNEYISYHNSKIYKGSTNAS